MARDRWASRKLFLYAAIGSAVGLGNIWRFPYLTYEFGGGAFLIPYLIALFVVGIPLLLLEFALGQKMQKGAVQSFKSISPKLRGIGVAALLAGFIVVVYYAAVMAWSLVYFVKSFGSSLPWASDSKAYFFNDVLAISSGAGSLGGLNLTLVIALFVVWLAIYLSVRKGTKSVGKVVAWTVPLPIIILAVLFLRGITLPGAFEGISYYLTPNFAALWSTEIWLAAISQIFFTLSVGFGIMIAYASFNKQSQDAASDTYITAITNSVISIFAGFVVFSVIGYMAVSTGVGVDEAVAGGPGLAFVVFPQALALMPFAWFFAALFFLMLLTLGIDSAFSLVEGATTAIGDNYRRPNKARIAFLVCGIAFLLGLLFVTGAGLYFLDIVDHFVTNYVIVIVGILGSLAVGWVYGADKMRAYINSVSSIHVGRWWNVAIKYVIPIVLTVLLVAQFVTDITTPYEGYPTWALNIGWLTVVIPLLIALWASAKKG